jgi:GTP cyclohydrolase III
MERKAVTLKLISETEIGQTLQATLVAELRKIVANEVMAAMKDRHDDFIKLIRPIVEEAIARTIEDIMEDDT